MTSAPAPHSLRSNFRSTCRWLFGRGRAQNAESPDPARARHLGDAGAVGRGDRGTRPPRHRNLGARRPRFGRPGGPLSRPVLATLSYDPSTAANLAAIRASKLASTPPRRRSWAATVSSSPIAAVSDLHLWLREHLRRRPAAVRQRRFHPVRRSPVVRRDAQAARARVRCARRSRRCSRACARRSPAGASRRSARGRQGCRPLPGGRARACSTGTRRAGGGRLEHRDLFAGRHGERARAAAEFVLFKVERDEDFSQFKPRGHYTDAPSSSPISGR